MITSRQNSKIQWVKALQARSEQRRESQAFVIEGVRLAEEALASGRKAQLALYTEDLDERGQQVVKGLADHGCPVEMVTPPVMRAASDTLSPQGLLIVISLSSLPIPEELNFVLIPDRLRDPGNLGSILRTALAAGVDAVVLPPGTVDVYAPKVVRSAMGAHFHLPIYMASWEEIYTLEQANKLQVYVAAANAGLIYSQVNLRQPLALVIGGEAEGASQAAWSQDHICIRIPMSARVESLNAAAAAAVLLFEVARQRQTHFSASFS